MVDPGVGLDVGGAVPESACALVILDNHHSDRTLQGRQAGRAGFRLYASLHVLTHTKNCGIQGQP